MKQKTTPQLPSKPFLSIAAFASVFLALVFLGPGKICSQTKPFHLQEATIEDVQAAYKSGKLTSHQLVQLYLDRIEAVSYTHLTLPTIYSV